MANDRHRQHAIGRTGWLWRGNSPSNWLRAHNPDRPAQLAHRFRSGGEGEAAVVPVRKASGRRKPVAHAHAHSRDSRRVRAADPHGEDREERSDGQLLPSRRIGPVCPALEVTSRKLSSKVNKRPPKEGQDRRRRALVIEAACVEQITTAQVAAFISGKRKSDKRTKMRR